ncbi:hypothetical protein BCV72DRAFT_242169 [Rhizopus microsporus var. microsporus]|uniref:Uncharacterized protein n=2 Tax=Rhizopus microsporus TaxID=58291 RepID=A0A2G4SM51_RHIZD|nr:uncharacterized protein RHIMIDRAFT_245565 [Rhizopus microsporus ATCC 52813]ORE06220.1 hypothetical protein BCV72DRAFT_242169 [Rhizopus microsporus var. microsporus]PHZ09840.1 hypothetical protein RHIMIDRAFT_245565 [Rhizopus microsporus ATCC 52813]
MRLSSLFLLAHIVTLAFALGEDPEDDSTDDVFEPTYPAQEVGPISYDFSAVEFEDTEPLTDGVEYMKDQNEEAIMDLMKERMKAIRKAREAGEKRREAMRRKYAARRKERLPVYHN